MFSSPNKLSRTSPSPDGSKGASDAALIAKALRTAIEQGEIGVDQTLPTERKLAERYEAGRWAVRHAIQELSDLGLVRLAPNCRPVVVSAVPKISFGKRMTNQIAVWISPDLEDFGAAKMLEGIRGVLGKKGLQLIVGCPPSRDPSEARAAVNGFVKAAIENPNVGGAILWALGDPALVPAYQALSDAGVPMVFIDREPPESVRADMVSTDHRRAARTAVRRLIELGHRSIAVVTNDDRASSVRERIMGYREAMTEAGLETPPEAIFEVITHPQARLMSDSEAAVQRLFGSKTPPTAIFAVNDTIAIYLQEAIEKTGRRIPQDVSLIGFDWMLRWLPSGGDLTSIAQPFNEIGQLAARCLIERIDSPIPPTYRHILLEAPLVVRRSCGAPKP